MKISFTICSNNYLAQAKTFIESFHSNNPGYLLFVGLADRKNKNIDYEMLKPAEIIPAEMLGLKEFEDIINKYTTIEFNTALKPYYFKYLFENYHPDHVFYFDPDILFLAELSDIETYFINYTLLLTPHITTPLEEDGLAPNEDMFLKYGIFNLGFVGIKNNDIGNRIIRWWGDRVFYNCDETAGTGVFTDQKWMNLAPIFWSKQVKILNHPGLNVAWWNLQERNIQKINNRYFVNNIFPLIFFHFSQFKLEYNDLSSVQNRFSVNNDPNLFDLWTYYRKKLINNNYEHFQKIKNEYYMNYEASEKLKQKEYRFARVYKLISRIIPIDLVLKIHYIVKNLLKFYKFR